MKKVLVTGANGQLGKCIQKIAADYYPDCNFLFKNSNELDITDKEQVVFLFNSNDFDFCINCAAYTNVDQAEISPEISFEVNAEGVKNLAISCKKTKVVLIHISTDYVFDGQKEGPYMIEDVPCPINDYGKSKLRGEEFIRQILKKYLIIRTSWLYSEFGKNFYKTILKKAKTENILYVTDEQIGCPTDANNLAKFILNIVDSKNLEFGLFHFTDGEAMTWYDFTIKILEENGFGKKVKVVRDKKYSTFAKRPKNSVLK